MNGRSTRNSRPPGAQVCDIFDCGIDKEQKLCHFLMPDLSVTHQEPPKEASVPHERVVEELLKYHIRWWNDPRLDEWPFMQRAGGPLRMAQAISEEDVRKSCADFEATLRTFVDEKGDELEPAWISTMERVIERYPDVFLGRVGDGDQITMLHGDSHLWNFYYSKKDIEDIVLFDWETFKRGLGAYDLAYLMVHGASGRERLEKGLMDFYYERLVAGGIENYSRELFEQDYRLSVISTTFCPLFWKRVFSMRSAMQAFADWECDELLD